MINTIKTWMQKHWKLSILLFVGIAFVLLLIGGISNRNAEKAKREEEASNATVETIPVVVEKVETEDSLLMRMQESLRQSFGKLPDGYIWDVDGSTLSLGDKSMPAEDVVYAYLNGLKSLDFSIVQKYSRRSTVVRNYSGFFDSKVGVFDYYESFTRNMYKECLLSLQVMGIENSSIFAENKHVYTVKVRMLDLTQKDFWKPDKATIYKTLHMYNKEDSTRSEMYLYDYILSYYKSDDAALREFTVDLTLERYPDLDTGWLVSIDSDIDAACRYADGKPVVRYINEMYLDEGEDYYKYSDDEPLGAYDDRDSGITSVDPTVETGSDDDVLTGYDEEPSETEDS